MAPVNYLLIILTFSFTSSTTLISLLINFVAIYGFAGCVLLIARECGIFIGLSYPIIYTGAVSVLFVYVVLLVENQHLGLAVFALTVYLYD